MSDIERYHVLQEGQKYIGYPHLDHYYSSFQNARVACLLLFIGCGGSWIVMDSHNRNEVYMVSENTVSEVVKQIMIIEKTKQCEMCEIEVERNIKVYDARDFITFYVCNICEECEENYLTDCLNCGKCIYDGDISYTDWHQQIPYEDDFESDEERYEIISNLESVFYCNICKPIHQMKEAAAQDIQNN